MFRVNDRNISAWKCFSFEQIFIKMVNEIVIPQEVITPNDTTKPMFRWDKQDKIKNFS